MCRNAALALLALFFLIGPAGAQGASSWADDLRTYYQAELRNDGPAMLKAAVRLAEKRMGSRWTTVVGDLYWQGRGTAADPAEAVKWYRRAAVRGSERAMLALARAHYQGRGAEQDHEAAYFWLMQAADRREPRASLEIAIYTRRGLPFARDESRAQRQIDRAVEMIYQRARVEEESRGNAMPARRATYVRTFRIFACPWAAPPDIVQARRFLDLAVKEGWSEGESFLPRFERTEPDLSSACERD